MKRLLWVALLCIGGVMGGEARGRAYGWCEQSNVTVSVPGASGVSTTRFQQSLPASTVTVYLSGTTDLATIYSDDAGTAKANPFTCPTSSSSAGFWFFYADQGRYDVKTSGTGVTTPFTLGDVTVIDPLNPLTRCYADAVQAGADIGAKINTCATNLTSAYGGGTIFVGCGSYNFTTSITIADDIFIQGCGRNGTVLNWTGSTSGKAFNLTNKDYVTLSSFTLNTNLAATTTGIYIAGSTGVTIEDFLITGTTTTTGFNTGIDVTGDGSTTAFFTIIKDGQVLDFTGIGINIKHAVETRLDNLLVKSVPNGTTANDIVVDSGTSGTYLNRTVGLHGLHGLFIRHTAVGVGAYNQSPIDIFGDQFEADITTGGDAILVDSSVSTNVLRFICTNCWASGAGLNTSSAVVTATANGIHITGGIGFTWMGGRIRANALNGVLIDDADASNVMINGSWITANNVTDNADGHGYYITAASTNNALLNNRIGNLMDSIGHQKYAFKIAAVAANEFRAEGNDLGNNETGGCSNAATGNYVILGNLPSSSPCAQTIWGNFTVATGGVSQLAVIDGSGVQIGNGSNYIVKYLTTTSALDFGAISANTCSDSGSIAISGIVAGDTVLVNAPTAFMTTACGGVALCLQVSGYVFSSGNARVRVCNVSGTVSSDPASASFRLDVWQH